MSITTTCPQCDKAYRVKPEQSGKRARCAACRHVFVVIGSATMPPSEWTPAAPVRTPELMPNDPLVAVQNSRAVEEEEFPEARKPDLEPPRPSTVSPFVRNSTLGRLALDRMKMTYALHWWGLWAVCVSIAGMLAAYVHPLIAPPVVLLVSWISLAGTVSGVSYLATQEIAREEAVHWSEAWGLFQRRSVSLVLGSWLLAAAALAAVAFLFAAVFAISHLPYVGGPIGGLLVAPVFVLILFACVLTCNLHLLVVIIGVEDCSAWSALTRLAGLIRRDWFALLGWSYLSPFLVTLGTTLAVGGLTTLGLSGALLLCGGEQLLLVLTDGVSLGNLLHVLSVAMVLAGALAFVTVFATLQFTVLYCRFA
jgi:predicted Zn finger-like uncharacterized protein